MYNYIIGKVTEGEGSFITLECSGIGYFINVPNPYSFEIGKEYKLLVNKNNPKEFWIAEDGTNRGREYIWIGVGVVFLIISYLFEVIKGVF